MKKMEMNLTDLLYLQLMLMIMGFIIGALGNTVYHNIRICMLFQDRKNKNKDKNKKG
jgi:hypothetical protein